MHGQCLHHFGDIGFGGDKLGYVMGGEAHQGVLGNVSGNATVFFLGPKGAKSSEVYFFSLSSGFLNSLKKDFQCQLDVCPADAGLLGNLLDDFFFLHGNGLNNLY